MDGDNPTGGDNQQGRSRGFLTPDYVSGFIDGEGCFSVSIHSHPSIQNPKRWLIAPVFQAYQHRDNVLILEMLRDYFGCGRLTAKGPNSSVMTYSVYGVDLERVIIPFFDRYPMLSRKHEDYLKFREVVKLMRQKLHRTDAGFRQIVRDRVLDEPTRQAKEVPDRRRTCETLRDCTPSAPALRDGVKIQSDPHGDMRRVAEMTTSPEITDRVGDLWE